VYPNSGENDCETLFGCFKFVLCYGLRQGGGITDVLNLSLNYGRWLIDETYFLLVIVMLLNIIFGIIIDTFSSLRAGKEVRLQDTEEVCFICGIGKQTFDRASEEPDGFLNHIKLDHNMWNYLYFIILLWEQDKDDDDGMEQYVRRCIAADEVIWFPQNKAIRLDQAESEEELTFKEIASKIKQVEINLTKKITNFHSELNIIVDQISAATKMEYKIGDVRSGIAQYLKTAQLEDLSADDGAESVTDLVAGDNVDNFEEESLGSLDDEYVEESPRTIHRSVSEIFSDAEKEEKEDFDDISHKNIIEQYEERRNSQNESVLKTNNVTFEGLFFNLLLIYWLN
jgi:hypothetical protein